MYLKRRFKEIYVVIRKVKIPKLVIRPGRISRERNLNSNDNNQYGNWRNKSGNYRGKFNKRGLNRDNIDETCSYVDNSNIDSFHININNCDSKFEAHKGDVI